MQQPGDFSLEVRMETKTCLQCGGEFNKKPKWTHLYWAARKYCSQQCYWDSKKGICPHKVEPKTVVIKCPDCGEERLLSVYVTRKPNFTGLCRNCTFKRSHLKRKMRTVEQRPLVKRSDGYLEISLPETHWCIPMASTHNTVLVHRLIMAEHLGRLLQPHEIVHHLNGIKDDNRIENFELATRATHQLTYPEGYAQGLKDGITMRDKALEKQIRLLQWNIKELKEALQLRFGV